MSDLGVGVDLCSLLLAALVVAACSRTILAVLGGSPGAAIGCDVATVRCGGWKPQGEGDEGWCCLGNRIDSREGAADK